MPRRSNPEEPRHAGETRHGGQEAARRGLIPSFAMLSFRMVLRGRHGLEVCLVDRNNIVYRGAHDRGDCERGRMGYAEQGMGGGCKKRLDDGARQGPTSPAKFTQCALSEVAQGVETRRGTAPKRKRGTRAAPRMYGWTML
jgi:hypothetical protein